MLCYGSRLDPGSDKDKTESSQNPLKSVRVVIFASIQFLICRDSAGVHDSDDDV